MKNPSSFDSIRSLNRREFLRASSATALALSSSLHAEPTDGITSQATLKAGDLTAVIGDNSAQGEHRSGYNGVWELRHSAGTRSVFVPTVAGLNLEHIVTGEKLEDRKTFFEPRNAPMSLKQLHWTQFCTQWHNDQSTVRHRDDMFEMSFPPGGRDALFKSLSRLRFDRPFFYGNFDDLIWLVMFDRAKGIRLTHSPSGGGANAKLQTSNPAWDFQFLVQKPEVMKEYSFRVRTVLRPRCSREAVLEEFAKWEETK